jgi:hypothetical protein
MFVEGEVEIQIKDRTVEEDDDYNVKVWIQRAFKDLSCYRISSFARTTPRMVKATVAIKTDTLPEAERKLIEGRGRDVGMLRTFIEKMFAGKGTCRAVGDPKLRDS